MSLRYYMDHNVHAAIVQGLRKRGIDCLTAHEDFSAHLDDEHILQRATSLNRVLFSQDTDLLGIAADWVAHGRSFAGVVYAGQLAITIGEAIFDLELIAMTLSSDEMANHVEFLPL